MPIISSSTYTAPGWLYNGHLQTIIPSLFRKVTNVNYERERIQTSDGDFLDLDWLKTGNNKLVIISHGLEGDSQRPYVKGMAKALKAGGWDVLAWNFRGCSGEMNKVLRFYHSGATDDLQLVIAHALNLKKYNQLALIGFSLGGNLTLKYLGEQPNSLPGSLKSAVVFSVPLHLHSSAIKISEKSNLIYSTRFLRNLKRKVKVKSLHMPGKLTLEHLKKIRSIQDFDDFYTAPIHGFKDASTYYAACSAINFLGNIPVPTLVVNAANDPFLSPACYPSDQLRNNTSVHLEIPEEGGHCGFPQYNTNGLYWSEKRALEFLSQG